MAENTVKEIREFFEVEGKPVKIGEFQEFWKSLTDDEKAYYKTANLA